MIIKLSNRFMEKNEDFFGNKTLKKNLNSSHQTSLRDLQIALANDLRAAWETTTAMLRWIFLLTKYQKYI